MVFVKSERGTIGRLGSEVARLHGASGREVRLFSRRAIRKIDYETDGLNAPVTVA